MTNDVDLSQPCGKCGDPLNESPRHREFNHPDMELYWHLLGAAEEMADEDPDFTWPSDPDDKTPLGTLRLPRPGSPWFRPQFENGELTLTFSFRDWQARTGFTGHSN